MIKTLVHEIACRLFNRQSIRSRPSATRTLHTKTLIAQWYQESRNSREQWIPARDKNVKTKENKARTDLIKDRSFQRASTASVTLQMRNVTLLTFTLRIMSWWNQSQIMYRQCQRVLGIERITSYKKTWRKGSVDKFDPSTRMRCLSTLEVSQLWPQSSSLTFADSIETESCLVIGAMLYQEIAHGEADIRIWRVGPLFIRGNGRRSQEATWATLYHLADYKMSVTYLPNRK